jgi:cation-transporting P-type ATPase D
MTTTTVRPTRAAGSATQRSLISDWWSIASVRWATVALCLFLAGLTAQLLNAPSGMWWTLYLACYVTGGWRRRGKACEPCGLAPSMSIC